MVDVAYFRKINPDYTRPHINELARPSSSNNVYVIFYSDTKQKQDLDRRRTVRIS